MISQFNSLVWGSRDYACANVRICVFAFIHSPPSSPPQEKVTLLKQERDYLQPNLNTMGMLTTSLWTIKFTTAATPQDQVY